MIEVKLNFELLVKYESIEEDACKEHRDIVKELLQSLHHVKNLTVGKWCLMVRFNFLNHSVNYFSLFRLSYETLPCFS